MDPFELLDDNFWFFVSILIGLVLLLAVIYGFATWLRYQSNSPGLYSKMPLRKASDLPGASKVRILRFFYRLQDFDNRIFNIDRAAFCRETNRIFPSCVSIFGKIKLDWTFLKKRYPGTFVSWGSLTDEQQRVIRDAHDSLEGFQTDFSCPEPAPRAITPEFCFTIPGPLYVDLETQVLLGWKVVPETDLEVLIVQKKKREHEFQVNVNKPL